MAIRYLVRNPKPEDFSDLKAKVSNLDQELGPAGEAYRRIITVTYSPLRHAHYMLVTRKAGNDWKWLCTGIELDAEDEKGMLALCDMYKIPAPSHLVRG